MTRILPLAALLALAGCSASQTATVNSVVADGQLFCSVASASGPIVTAIIDAATKAPVTVTNQAASVVANVCKIVGGIPVIPPVNPAQAPTVAVAVPAAGV